MNVHEAKTKLSQLIRAVEAGERVVISRAGKPVVQLVPVADAPKPTKRKMGQLRGLFTTPDDFNEPLPDAFWRGED